MTDTTPTTPTTKAKADGHDIALMARELVLVTLPHKDPGNVPTWTRQNGNLTLRIQPGYQKDPKTQKEVCVGYPYGSLARLILYWIVTEARRTGNPRLTLGKSLTTFLRKLGLAPDDSSGKRSTAASVRRQIERLIAARITFEQTLENAGKKGRKWLDMPIAKGGELWWDISDDDQETLWDSFVILNDDFFRAITTNPIPVRMMTLLALKKSPLGLDLYAWATFESAKAQHNGQGRFVAWGWLHEQFGTELGRMDRFVTKAKRELQKIMLNCPSIQLAFVRGGLRVLDTSLPDVSLKGALPPLPPPPLSTIPSAEALRHVREDMTTRKGSIMIALEFQEAVKNGRAENTDAGYIAFAERYRTV